MTDFLPQYEEPNAPSVDFAFLKKPLSGGNLWKTLATALGAAALAKDPGQTLGAVAGGLNAYQGARTQRAEAAYQRAMNEWKTREELRRYEEQRAFQEKQAALDEAYRQAALAQRGSQFDRGLGADLGRFGASEFGLGSPIAQSGFQAAGFPLPAPVPMPAGASPNGWVPAASGAPQAALPPAVYSPDPGSAAAGRSLQQAGQALENQRAQIQMPAVQAEADAVVQTAPLRLPAVMNELAQGRVRLDQMKTELASMQQKVGEDRETFALRKKQLELAIKDAEKRLAILDQQSRENQIRLTALPGQIALDNQGKVIKNYTDGIVAGIQPQSPEAFLKSQGLEPMPAGAMPVGGAAPGEGGYPLFPKGVTTVANRLATMGFGTAVPFDVAQDWFTRWVGQGAFKVRDLVSGETAYEIDPTTKAGQNARDEMNRLNARYSAAGGAMAPATIPATAPATTPAKTPAKTNPKPYTTGVEAVDRLFQ